MLFPQKAQIEIQVDASDTDFGWTLVSISETYGEHMTRAMSFVVSVLETQIRRVGYKPCWTRIHVPMSLEIECGGPIQILNTNIMFETFEVNKMWLIKSVHTLMMIDDAS